MVCIAKVILQINMGKSWKDWGCMAIKLARWAWRRQSMFGVVRAAKLYVDV